MGGGAKRDVICRHHVPNTDGSYWIEPGSSDCQPMLARRVGAALLSLPLCEAASFVELELLPEAGGQSREPSRSALPPLGDELSAVAVCDNVPASWVSTSAAVAA
ncbi:hypothetical protein DYGSA30_15930 [Dyella sp. GSA-30]|nr:hypothetical protein DYGSA30_15930 [Dyella sp. GSA-30]